MRAISQPYLKFHNPKTFEDLEAPVPNFRALNLKAGEVPKFFDSVLARRADESIEEVSMGGGNGVVRAQGHGDSRREFLG